MHVRMFLSSLRSTTLSPPPIFTVYLSPTPFSAEKRETGDLPPVGNFIKKKVPTPKTRFPPGVIFFRCVSQGLLFDNSRFLRYYERKAPTLEANKPFSFSTRTSIGGCMHLFTVLCFLHMQRAVAFGLFDPIGNVSPG